MCLEFSSLSGKPFATLSLPQTIALTFSCWVRCDSGCSLLHSLLSSHGALRKIRNFFATFAILGTKNTPGAIRTRDPLLRRQLLYPAELRTHKVVYLIVNFLLFSTPLTHCLEGSCSIQLSYGRLLLYLFNHINFLFQQKFLSKLLQL